MWLINIRNPISCLGVKHQNLGTMYISAAGYSETPNSELEAELDTFVRGNTCNMLLSSLLWVFMAFIFPGSNGSNVSKNVMGERMAHRHIVLHMDLRGKDYPFNLVCLWILN